MNLQSTLKGYVCQLKNRKSRNGRTVDDSSETLVQFRLLTRLRPRRCLMERTSRNHVWGDVL